MNNQFSFKTIEDYQQQLADGRIKCRETVEHYLSRIREKKHLNAFVEVFADEALKRADELDEMRKNGNQPGKLHGVVVAIKDVICYKDHKITAASRILQGESGGFISLYNSTVVERLLSQEAIIIGNCNCDEFAMGSSNENSAYGSVLNELDETKVPGGSSGGSAVAVQADLCMVSLGSDTGGSVRQPADFCGIIGLKPSYGRISRHGLIAYASSFDQVGIFGNNIEDISLVLEIISGWDEFDSTVANVPICRYADMLMENTKIVNEDNRKYKLAYFKNAMEYPALDPEIKRSIEELFGELERNGHQVTELDFELLEYIVPTYYVLTTAEASSNLSRYDGVRYGYREITDDLSEMYTKTRNKGFGKEVKRRIMLGNFVLSTGYYDAFFTKAQQVRKKLVDQVDKIFMDFDAILIPTVPSTAFDIGSIKDPVEMYLADIFTVFANLTGIPAVSLPLFKHINNMPFGLQVMANKYNEVTLLSLSARLLKDYRKVPDQ